LDGILFYGACWLQTFASDQQNLSMRNLDLLVAAAYTYFASLLRVCTVQWRLAIKPRWSKSSASDM
jgi:hypothetical protein